MLVIRNRRGWTMRRIDQPTLEGAQLAGSDFREASLAGLVLRGAQLSGSDFRSADLTGAVLVGASLAGADLRNALFVHTDLSRADLRGADLRGSLFTGALAEQVNLTGADLRGVRLLDADLRGADLRGADLRGLSLLPARLENAVLVGAALRGTELDCSARTIDRMIEVLSHPEPPSQERSTVFRTLRLLREHNPIRGLRRTVPAIRNMLSSGKSLAVSEREEWGELLAALELALPERADLPVTVEAAPALSSSLPRPAQAGVSMDGLPRPVGDASME